MTDDERHVRPQRHASFRFYAELNDFLPIERRQRAFSYGFHGTPSVKDTIEAIGVPHTEVDLILVNGQSVGFDYQVRDGDRISIYPVFESLDISPVTHLRPRPLRVSRFVLDQHLGKLAAYLRMLGFDALYRALFVGGSEGTAAGVAVLELVARLLGAYDWYLLRRDHRIWEPAETSKEMIVKA